MDGSMPSWNNNNVDIISSDESSSDSDMEITDSLPSKLFTEIPILQPKVDMEIAQASIGIITPQDPLIKRAEMYQDYMKQIPIPSHRGSVVPFKSWTGLGNSIKNLYGQPLHYLTNSQLKQWDRLRIGTDDEYEPLDSIIHPSKAEATIWLLEEVHRRTTSHHNVAKLWLSDPMHYAFVDSIFPKLGNA